MSDKPTDVSEVNLHAYADGQLTAADRRNVAAWLDVNPDDALKVAEWQNQNSAIRLAFSGSKAARPQDAELLGKAHRRRVITRKAALVAAAVMIFIAGAAAYRLAGLSLAEPVQIASASELPKQAKSAYLVYASEVRHPVEVFAPEEAHLAKWLGKRLEIDDLKVPNLASLGFHLVGGRLLPIDGRPAAMFMYEDQEGQRVTVLVGRDSANATTAFRFEASNGVETFYWIDNDFGYAVSGEISRNRLQAVAETCYAQFDAKFP